MKEHAAEKEEAMTQAPLSRAQLYEIGPDSIGHQPYSVRKAILEMALAAARIEHEGWVPIETAPKNRPVLLANAAHPTFMRFGFWGGECEGRSSWADPWAGRFKEGDWEPTHWRELPPPPQQDGKEENARMGSKELREGVGVAERLDAGKDRRGDCAGNPSPDTDTDLVGAPIAPHPEQECEHVPAAVGGGKGMRERGNNRTLCRKCNRVLRLTWDNKFVPDAPLAASGGEPIENTSLHGLQLPSPAPAAHTDLGVGSSEVDGLIERLRGDTQMSDRPWAVELMLEAAAALDGMRRKEEKTYQQQCEAEQEASELTAALTAAQSEISKLQVRLDASRIARSLLTKGREK